MTTVTDPTGTPTVFYDRSGKTVVSVVANGAANPEATDFSAMVVIPMVSAHTIVLLTVGTDANSAAAALPDTVDPGSFLDLYTPTQGAGAVFLPLGDNVVNGDPLNPGARFMVEFGSKGVTCHKVSPTVWVTR